MGSWRRGRRRLNVCHSAELARKVRADGVYVAMVSAEHKSDVFSRILDQDGSAFRRKKSSPFWKGSTGIIFAARSTVGKTCLMAKPCSWATTMVCSLSKF